MDDEPKGIQQFVGQEDAGKSFSVLPFDKLVERDRFCAKTQLESSDNGQGLPGMVVVGLLDARA